MKINLQRAKSAAASDTAMEIAQAVAAGQPIDDVIADQLMEHAINKFRPHIAAALRRHGVNLDDDATLDADTLMTIVNEKSGLSLDGWSADSVLAAVDTMIAARVSVRLGVEVQSVQDVEGLRQSLIDSAVSAIQSGRANAFISRAMISKFRKEKAFRESGMETEDDQRKLMNRWYQKKYRRTHKAVWAGSGGDV